jgi:alpha-tubulin suppressor-like RCC1 family protein
VTGLPGPVAQIVVATGGSHTCAVLTSGDVWCWGYNSSGELGDGTVNNSPTPVKVGGLAKAASAVGAGSDFSCAILTDGSMACWGSKFYGVLGDGMSDFTSVLSAQAVPNLPGTASNLALGWNDGCATIAGSPYCWGWNGLGQIGNGLTDGSIYGVTKVGTASITAVTTAMGGDFGCFLQAGGVVQCWGYNNYGQVGNGTISTGGVPAIASPKFVTGLSSVAVVQLAVGGDFACVLTGTGTVYCWGNNSVGQLGTGSLSPASNATPGLVSGLPKASAISAGCALMPNGSVWSWGANVGATPVEVPGW